MPGRAYVRSRIPTGTQLMLLPLDQLCAYGSQL